MSIRSARADTAQQRLTRLAAVHCGMSATYPGSSGLPVDSLIFYFESGHYRDQYLQNPVKPVVDADRHQPEN
jgi:hypothetical protein